ncbi:tRNA (adenosine(37)-N6)-threonylcarbamoyltransferase complex dimerization subunit type 1 TsaB [Knoellia aerolata]|uniref:tRNA (adenosine(37)-N6)-threonylcarbamoyltransferase complex dimerization subunit type 1 TsaB n=1 Tax=Knoellia aerolata TaxID=442954 RepID=UPI00056A3D41|nr:tRNA (adenosine(37)-N6)-threonylcarbamoyltransferase complex dimerization subunit type 1 TsaB [Knoellia aerolata]
MLILAIDTSTSAITVALHDDTRVLAAASHIDPRAHTEWVSPLIASCLASASLSPADLTAVAVGNGPGPFTGLRVGIVTGLTMGHALGVPVHGICSLDVLAAQAAPTVRDGELLVATDARRKEVYWSRYAVRSGHVERLTFPAVERPADLTDDVRALPTVGRGPVLWPELFPDPVPVLDVDAAVLARLAVERARDGEEMPVEPLYLRRPDALTTAERAAR